MLRCSEESAAHGNDPAGSATTFRRYLLIDHLQPWSAAAAEDALAAHLDDAARTWVSRQNDLRAFAIRPVTDRRSAGAGTFVIGTAGPQAGYRRMADAPTGDENAEDVAGDDSTPFLAVCTNGKRDRCCAIDGRALAQELHSEFGDRILEISHLGGHRFAPTALLFPWAYSYAFLTPQTAADAIRLADRGLIAPQLLRGRADLSEPEQAAEIHWRRQLGPAAPGAVVITGTTPAGGEQEVHAIVDGTRESLRLRYQQTGTVEESVCGGKPFALGRWLIS